MAIRHVVTIQVAPGRTGDFLSAFKALQEIAQHEEGCEQYELFQSLSGCPRVGFFSRDISKHAIVFVWRFVGGNSLQLHRLGKNSGECTTIHIVWNRQTK